MGKAFERKSFIQIGLSTRDEGRSGGGAVTLARKIIKRQWADSQQQSLCCVEETSWFSKTIFESVFKFTIKQESFRHKLLLQKPVKAQRSKKRVLDMGESWNLEDLMYYWSQTQNIFFQIFHGFLKNILASSAADIIHPKHGKCFAELHISQGCSRPKRETDSRRIWENSNFKIFFAQLKVCEKCDRKSKVFQWNYNRFQ